MNSPSGDDLVLPGIDPVAVDRLTAYLRGKSWSQRPANATARVLALMVRLWEERQPFPTRQQVAVHVGVSVPTVDLVLRRHRTGELDLVYEGGAPQVRGKRWVVPSDEIRSIGKTDHLVVPEYVRAPYRRKRQGVADSIMALT